MRFGIEMNTDHTRKKGQKQFDVTRNASARSRPRPLAAAPSVLFLSGPRSFWTDLTGSFRPLAHAWLEQRTHNPLVPSSDSRGPHHIPLTMPKTENPPNQGFRPPSRNWNRVVADMNLAAEPGGLLAAYKRAWNSPPSARRPQEAEQQVKILGRLSRTFDPSLDNGARRPND